MYHVSAQGVDERMINVHYYYYCAILADTLSLASTISMRAFSNPPPYSPPHSASRPGGQVNAAGRDQVDVAL